MPRLITPLDEIIFKLLKHEPVELEIDQRVCLGVVLASKGYPGKTEIQGPIHHLDQVDSTIYHMGTTKQDNVFYNQGGRVLCVTALAESLEEAKAKVYQDLKKIEANQCFYRNDIGSSV